MNIDKKKVMVVEDDEHIARVYAIKLGNEGIDVSIAHDGEEAIMKIDAERPDLILLDLMLPKIDGFGVLEEVKKSPELGMIPVIVVSNLWKEEDQYRALALGANEFLVKVEYPIQEIVDKVKGYLKD